MTRIRRLVALALATPLATGCIVLGTGLPAHASAGITSPASGAVITSGTSVYVSADAGWTPATLSVHTPEGNDVNVGSKGLTNPLQQSFKLSGSVPIPTNGRYTVNLTGSPSRDFYVKLPPAAPGGLSATASGSRINVSWNQGTEIDLTGYSVSVSGGSSKSGSVDSFCSGSTCSTNVTTSATGSVNVTVTARRSGGTSASSSTSVMVGGGSNGVAPSVPRGANPGGNPNGPTMLAPANGNSPVNLPNVAPDGSNPDFVYPTPPPQVAQSQLSPKARSMSAVNSALQWGRSVAITLILLVCAAHLGTWTRRLRLVQGVAGGRYGSGSRASRLGRARVSVAQARIAQAEAQAKAGALSMQAGLTADPVNAADPAESTDPVDRANADWVDWADAADTVDGADLSDQRNWAYLVNPADPADPVNAALASAADPVSWPDPVERANGAYPANAVDEADGAAGNEVRARKGLLRRSRGSAADDASPVHAESPNEPDPRTVADVGERAATADGMAGIPAAVHSVEKALAGRSRRITRRGRHGGARRAR